ncbi:pyocin S6 family toxin immunity protein [Pseudomonas chengduensis]|nr:pyocin S6 family toxin immunity protein [Pseudomonas chengduensis]MDH1683630.1 pyocin S6 family toxin immunity protein [Pseudomonas chengduensis]
MRICVTGFLPDDSDDDSIKFELIVSADQQQAVMDALGWQDLAEEADGELLLTDQQVELVSGAIGTPFPKGLDIFIGVIAS